MAYSPKNGKKRKESDNNLWVEKFVNGKSQGRVDARDLTENDCDGDFRCYKCNKKAFLYAFPDARRNYFRCAAHTEDCVRRIKEVVFRVAPQSADIMAAIERLKNRQDPAAATSQTASARGSNPVTVDADPNQVLVPVSKGASLTNLRAVVDALERNVAGGGTCNPDSVMLSAKNLKDARANGLGDISIVYARRCSARGMPGGEAIVVPKGFILLRDAFSDWRADPENTIYFAVRGSSEATHNRLMREIMGEWQNGSLVKAPSPHNAIAMIANWQRDTSNKKYIVYLGTLSAKSYFMLDMS